jgi:hypothetical protein
MSGVRVALAAGLVLTAALGIVLSRSPPVVARNNAASAERELAITPGSASVCQANELVPARTTAVRLGLEADLGPRMLVEVRSGERTVTGGDRGAGWADAAVTVHLKPLGRAVSHATVCFSFTGEDESVTLLGEHTPASVAATSSAGTLPGRVRIEYLEPGRSPWWSLASSVATRMGLGRAWSGAGIAWLVGTLALITAALALWLTVRVLP